MRVLTWNIRYGGSGREQDLAATIRAAEADVVLLQEATSPAVVEAVARATDMAQWGTSRRQSLGFLSRTPVDHFEWKQPRVSRHAFLELVPAGGGLHLFGVHLSAVHAAWTERRRLLEVRALIETVKARAQGFHLLAGDFNSGRHEGVGRLLSSGWLPAGYCEPQLPGLVLVEEEVQQPYLMREAYGDHPLPFTRKVGSSVMLRAR